MSGFLQSPTRVLERIISDRFKKVTQEIHTKLGKEWTQQKFHDKGEYECILLPTESFLKYINDAMVVVKGDRYGHDLSFVDAGCGTGHKLLLARALGFKKVTGIDIEPEYLTAAKEIIGQFRAHDAYDTSLGDGIEFVCEDIRNYNYSEFDIIYFYVPLQNTEKETEFEKRIIKTAKPGAIIIGAGNKYLYKSKRLINYNNVLFEKK